MCTIWCESTSHSLYTHIVCSWSVHTHCLPLVCTYMLSAPGLYTHVICPWSVHTCHLPLVCTHMSSAPGLYTHVICPWSVHTCHLPLVCTHIICCHRCYSTLASQVPSVTSTLGKHSTPPSMHSTTCPPPRSSAPWELCSRRRMTRRHISGSTRPTPGAEQFFFFSY